MKSYNKVILIGNIASDVEIKELDNGMKVVNLSLATNQKRLNKTSNEWESFADFHYVACWDKQAEVAEKYVHKGDQVFVEGRLAVNTYTNKEGIQTRTVNVIANSINVLNSKFEKPEEFSEPAKEKETIKGENLDKLLEF